MAIIKRKRKSGNKYQVKLRGIDGKWMSQTCDSRSEAILLESELKSQLKRGNNLSSTSRSITVAEFWKISNETYSQNITKGWIETKNQLFRDYILETIGSVKISKVTPQHISKVLTQMEVMGRGEQSRLHVYSLLRKLFNCAIEDFDIITKNPAIRSLKPRLPSKEADYLKVEDLRKLLIYCRSKPFGLAIWIGGLLGMRVGEIQALKWENVDLEEKTLFIRTTYARKEKEFRNYPKGRKWRTLRVPPELLELLKVHHEADPESFVVTGSRAEFLDYDIYRRTLRRYCGEVGIKPISTHALRHSATGLYQSFGASKDDLQELLGHTSVKVTERYIHSEETSLTRLVGKLKVQ